jgi:hypothetical protein
MIKGIAVIRPIKVVTELRAVSDAERLVTIQDFQSLKEKRSFERQYLPFLKTVVDFDIACEVGYHQLAGTPLTVKHLLLMNLAPPVTVFRRLARLCKLGVITRVRSQRDLRVQELRLSPGVLSLYANYRRTAATAEHDPSSIRARPKTRPTLVTGTSDDRDETT